MGYDMDMSKEKKRQPLLPEGIRKFRVLEVESGTSKKGNHQFVWTLEDQETRQTVDVYAIAIAGKRWFLKEILKACGVEVKDGEKYVFELSDLKGKIVEAEVEHYKDDWINTENERVFTTKMRLKNFR